MQARVAQFNAHATARRSELRPRNSNAPFMITASNPTILNKILGFIRTKERHALHLVKGSAVENNMIRPVTRITISKAMCNLNINKVKLLLDRGYNLLTPDLYRAIKYGIRTCPSNVDSYESALLCVKFLLKRNILPKSIFPFVFCRRLFQYVVATLKEQDFDWNYAFSMVLQRPKRDNLTWFIDWFFTHGSTCDSIKHDDWTSCMRRRSKLPIYTQTSASIAMARGNLPVLKRFISMGIKPPPHTISWSFINRDTNMVEFMLEQGQEYKNEMKHATFTARNSAELEWMIKEKINFRSVPTWTRAISGWTKSWSNVSDEESSKMIKLLKHTNHPPTFPVLHAFVANGGDGVSVKNIKKLIALGIDVGSYAHEVRVRPLIVAARGGCGLRVFKFLWSVCVQGESLTQFELRSLISALFVTVVDNRHYNAAIRVIKFIKLEIKNAVGDPHIEATLFKNTARGMMFSLLRATSGFTNCNLKMFKKILRFMKKQQLLPISIHDDEEDSKYLHNNHRYNTINALCEGSWDVFGRVLYMFDAHKCRPTKAALETLIAMNLSSDMIKTFKFLREYLNSQGIHLTNEFMYSTYKHAKDHGHIEKMEVLENLGFPITDPADRTTREVIVLNDDGVVETIVQTVQVDAPIVIE